MAYSFIDVGYIAPPALTLADVEAINTATQAALGYAVFGYWLFFNGDEAAPILDSHVSFPVALLLFSLHTSAYMKPSIAQLCILYHFHFE